MNANETHEEILEDIVVGLVSPIGTDLDSFCQMMESSFERLGYTTHVIRLSALLDEVAADFRLDLIHKDENERYDKYMNAGNRFRTEMGRGDALSMLAVGAIREIRSKFAARKRVFILRSLKHDGEVQSLRNIYGPAFLLFSLGSTRTARVKYLANRICKSKRQFNATLLLQDAEGLINRDQQEPDDPMGQKVGKLFHLADFFIDVDTDMAKAVKRLVELLLGNVFITPTRDEQGMFLAHASAWRSASLQRQVGAVITAQDGSVISIGTNEVPKPNGGLYWGEDEPDHRDFRSGGEINDDMKNRMLVEVIQRIISSGMRFLDNSDGSAHELAGVSNAQQISDWLIQKGRMNNTRIMSVIEFGRCVHAEMAALMDAARRGVAVDGAYLYSTTFPCHECARHIVAAGIRKVFYIEPYPKSLVNELYPDSIRIEDRKDGEAVAFIPFVGVAPKRYQDLFKTGDSDRKSLIKFANDWKASVVKPRLGEYPRRTQMINILSEKTAFEQFARDFERKQSGNGQT